MSVNPVLAKELRDRVRTWRSPVVITIYTGVLALVAGLFYYTQTRFNYGGPQTLRLGIEIFDLLAFLQLLLVAFLTPGMTAGIISGERERQTLPLLLVTRVSPFAVTWGKLLSAISYILLLILVSLPLYSIVFLFGGVSLGQLLGTAGMLLATTVTMGSIGILCSAVLRRTTVAVVASYMITFFLFIGTLFFALILQSLMVRVAPVQGQLQPIPFPFYFNPLVALGSTLPMGSNFLPFIGGNGLGGQPVLPIWQVNLIIDAVIVVVAVGLTVWLIQPLRRGTRRGD